MVGSTVSPSSAAITRSSTACTQMGGRAALHFAGSLRLALALAKFQQWPTAAGSQAEAGGACCASPRLARALRKPHWPDGAACRACGQALYICCGCGAAQSSNTSRREMCNIHISNIEYIY